MATPLVFFVDPAWKKPGIIHIPLLFPFWGNAFNKEKMPFYWQLFERHSFDTTYYTLTDSVAKANMILAPYGHNHLLAYAPEILEACVRVSQESGKPLLVDGIGDIEQPFAIPNSFILRYGGYRFLKKENEIHIPPYADDLLEAYGGGALHVRHKAGKPSISFAGWAGLTARQEFAAIVKEFPDRVRSLFDRRYSAKKKGVFVRREAVAILEKSPLVESHFLVRRSYSGHKDTAEKNPEQLRREFVDTILGSDYALDVRGDANASVRLFEILSLGRIPIIVDTERNFPFSGEIDYKSFSLVVDFRDLKQLPRIVDEFHSALTDEQFVSMQKNARDAYTHYFRVDAITRPLLEAVRNK